MPSQEYKNIITINLSSFSNKFSLFEEENKKFTNSFNHKKGVYTS